MGRARRRDGGAGQPVRGPHRPAGSGASVARRVRALDLAGRTGDVEPLDRADPHAASLGAPRRQARGADRPLGRPCGLRRPRRCGRVRLGLHDARRAALPLRRGRSERQRSERAGGHAVVSAGGARVRARDPADGDPRRRRPGGGDPSVRGPSRRAGGGVRLPRRDVPGGSVRRRARNPRATGPRCRARGRDRALDAARRADLDALRGQRPLPLRAGRAHVVRRALPPRRARDVRGVGGRRARAASGRRGDHADRRRAAFPTGSATGSGRCAGSVWPAPPACW